MPDFLKEGLHGAASGAAWKIGNVQSYGGGSIADGAAGVGPPGDALQALPRGGMAHAMSRLFSHLAEPTAGSLLARGAADVVPLTPEEKFQQEFLAKKNRPLDEDRKNQSRWREVSAARPLPRPCRTRRLSRKLASKAIRLR